ncbi:MAG TPA: Gfo/Idh/MocA family oxidoreductase [Bryobacteraceae bacterium]
MRILSTLTCIATTLGAAVSAVSQPASSFQIGVVGLVHGHVAGFFNTALKRPDVRIIGIAEPDRKLFDKYAARYHLDPALYFSSLAEMLSKAHPPAVVLYTSTLDHRSAVEECARSGVHVMMEKPLAVSYRDALSMAEAARKGNIRVLVNYETTWYASNKAAYDLLKNGSLGDLRRVVVHDGHQGPKEIGVQPEFFHWLTDPKLNGAGALFDFGCYGADLATWLSNGKLPGAVTAVTQQIKPDIYPRVDDEANIVLEYPKAVAILQASWNWPFDRKDMEVYGRVGYVKTIRRDKIDVRLENEKQSHVMSPEPLYAPYDDSLHYFAAVIAGEVKDEHSLSSLDTNVLVTEILDAARRSAKEGRTIRLPLND